jgi:hypothetical protein
MALGLVWEGAGAGLRPLLGGGVGALRGLLLSVMEEGLGWRFRRI